MIRQILSSVTEWAEPVAIYLIRINAFAMSWCGDKPTRITN